MEKFKVGDIVKACDDERYSYTSAKNEWVGKVIRIYDDGEFEAKTIKTRNGNKGVVYRLNSGYFELMKRPRTNYVLVSNQATIFFDENGEKYVSKCSNEEFDLEKGIMMCLCKKHGYTYQDIRRLLKNVEFKEVERRGSVLSNFVAFCENPLASGTKFQDTRDIDVN